MSDPTLHKCGLHIRLEVFIHPDHHTQKNTWDISRKTWAKFTNRVFSNGPKPSRIFFLFSFENRNKTWSISPMRKRIALIATEREMDIFAHLSHKSYLLSRMHIEIRGNFDKYGIFPFWNRAISYRYGVNSVDIESIYVTSFLGEDTGIDGTSDMFFAFENMKFVLHDLERLDTQSVASIPISIAKDHCQKTDKHKHSPWLHDDAERQYSEK